MHLPLLFHSPASTIPTRCFLYPCSCNIPEFSLQCRSLLFQRALSISPVSLTVPYLSFTPAVLLITSYFMLGEVPEAAGVLGVVIMTAGAYGLNTAGARREDENENARPSRRADASLTGPVSSLAVSSKNRSRVHRRTPFHSPCHARSTTL